MSALFKKLNLADCERILVLNAPESFESELSQLEGVDILRRATKSTKVDFAIGFAITIKECDSLSKKLAQATSGDAVIWMAYPKGSSKKYRCEFNRDTGWSEFGKAGFEPVRQVAIDEDWSALRFRRVEYIKSLTRRKSMTISDSGKKRTKGK